MAERLLLGRDEKVLLSAYLDGELTGDERRRVEALLQESNLAREFLAGLRKDQDLLRSALTLAPLSATRLEERRQQIKIALGGQDGAPRAANDAPATESSWLAGLLGWRPMALAGLAAATLVFVQARPPIQGLQPPTRIAAVTTPATPPALVTPETLVTPVDPTPDAEPDGGARIIEFETGAGGAFFDLKVATGSIATRFHVPEMGIEVLWVMD